MNYRVKKNFVTKKKMYTPIIIIGAPRSGTNMLRDILCSFRGIGTWPCDEINFIWRHYNINKDTDEFNEGMASEKVKKYIHNKFDLFAKKENLKFLVEKTCANSLRVPYVNKIIPNAKYIFIVRDGVDVAGSASIRWKAKLNFIYILKKIRYVPFSDLFFYTYNFLKNRLHKLFSKNKRLSFWGPQFKGIQSIFSNYALEEACILQWQKCVDLSEKAFDSMDNNVIVRVRYEDFVLEPSKELTRIMNELDISCKQEKIESVVRIVKSKSIGKGRKNLSKSQLNAVSKLASKTLNRYGYKA